MKGGTKIFLEESSRMKWARQAKHEARERKGAIITASGAYSDEYITRIEPVNNEISYRKPRPSWQTLIIAESHIHSARVTFAMNTTF